MKPYLAIVKGMEPSKGSKHAVVEFGTTIFVPMYDQNGDFQTWGLAGVCDNPDDKQNYQNLVVNKQVSDELFDGMHPQKAQISAKYRPQVDPIPTIYNLGPKNIGLREWGFLYVHNLSRNLRTANVTDQVYSALESDESSSVRQPIISSIIPAIVWQKNNRTRSKELYAIISGRDRVHGTPINKVSPPTPHEIDMMRHLVGKQSLEKLF